MRVIHLKGECFDKKQNTFFFRIFFHKYKLCIVWNWFIAKIILILKNSYFEAIQNGANQTEYFRLEQISVIKFLVAEMCKPCEVYRRVFDVNRETCFSQKIVYKWGKHEFATMSLNQKDSPWSGSTLTR